MAKVPKGVANALKKIEKVQEREDTEEKATKAIEAWRKNKTRENQGKALAALVAAKQAGSTMKTPSGLTSLH